MKTVGTSNVNVAMDFGDGGNKTFSVGQDWKRYAISAVHHDYGSTTKFIDLSFSQKKLASESLASTTLSLPA